MSKLNHPGSALVRRLEMPRKCIGFAVGAGLLLCLSFALAQPEVGPMQSTLERVGGEFQVNTFSLGDEGFGHAAIAADGSFVLVWDSCDPNDIAFGPLAIDGHGCGVAARAYDSLGQPVGPEFLVNQYTVGIQGNPSIGMDAAGDFVVAWNSHNQDSPGSRSIYARRFAAGGTPLPAPPTLASKYGAVGDEFRVNNTVNFGRQTQPTVAMAPGGAFVIAWNSIDVSQFPDDPGAIFTIQAHRFDKHGRSLGDFRVNTTSGRAGGATVAMADDGAFVIAWTNAGLEFFGFPDPDGDGGGIYAMLYDSLGNELAPTPGQRGSGQGNERQINSTVAASQTDPSAAMADNGEFVIAWMSRDTGDQDILAKRFGPTGEERRAPRGASLRGRNEFEVNSYKFLDQVNVNVGIDDAGRLAIAWSSNGQDDASPGFVNGGVFARIYDEQGQQILPPSGLVGTGIGGEMQLNTTTFGNQRLQPGHPLAIGRDRIVVAWSDGGFGEPLGDGNGAGYFGQIIRIADSD